MATGTMECPICGVSTPHGHDEAKAAALHADRLRGDGWISVATRQPYEPGYYLAFGHSTLGERDVVKRVRDDRDEAEMGPLVEVLGWDPAGGFYLCTWPRVGAGGSAPRRLTLYVMPTFWRPCPAPPDLATPPPSADYSPHPQSTPPKERDHMATKKRSTSAPSLPKRGSRPVLVTTEHRGVFFGYADDTSGETIKLRAARCCVYWSKDVQGFLGLASKGPTSSCRVGPPADAELRSITCVAEVTPAAVKAWEAQPWG